MSTKKIKLYDIDVTINGKIETVIDEDYRINIILYTSYATCSFKTFRKIIYGRNISDTDLIDYFRNYMESIIYYVYNKDTISKEVKRIYYRKYNGYKKIFGDISPINIYQEFKLKYL